MSEDTGTLRVHPNAFAAHDAKGRPCAAYPLEGLAGRDRYVGAEVDHVRTKKIGKRVFLPVGFARTKETTADAILAAWIAAPAIEVADSAYYRNALVRGDLLPADAETATTAKLPESALVGAAALAAAHDRMKAALAARVGTETAPAAAAAPKAPEPKTTPKSAKAGDPQPKESTP